MTSPSQPNTDDAGATRANEARGSDVDAPGRDVAPTVTKATMPDPLAGFPVPRAEIERLIDAALAEDIGPGDVTTLATVAPEAQAFAEMLAKAPGRIVGLPIAAAVFARLDPQVEFQALVAEGMSIDRLPREIANIRGPARSILTGERVALNIVQRLSGVATMAARCAKVVEGTRARILDTRKTTPGMRALEKYAVRMGGGHNHRTGLYDGILIKDNHIRAAGGITAAIRAARRYAQPLVRVEVEVSTRIELEEALEAGADMILLDNMRTSMLRTAVELAAGRALLEASGGITLQNLHEVAETGVDFISLGAITHSAPALDISLDLELKLSEGAYSGGRYYQIVHDPM